MGEWNYEPSDMWNDRWIFYDKKLIPRYTCNII